MAQRVMKKILYLMNNFLFVFHLMFGTKHFGVNNKLWSKDSSLFHVPFYKGIFTLPMRIRMMKKRAFMGFIPISEAKDIFPEYYDKNYGTEKR